VDELRTASGLDLVTEWDRFDPATPAGQWAGARREHLARQPRRQVLPVDVPERSGVRTGSRPISTQEAFGRVLTELSRLEEVSPYLVTTAPDVATSTNLAGFINRVGVFAPKHRRAWSQDPVLKWAEGPDGQHIELGISEMNLFGLLGQLGLSWDLSDQPLLPIGTVYDPFVLRGLDALIHAVYSGSRFVVAGTPSGVTLAPEGGAHQSTITPSVGLELPGVTLCEPAYAGALDWMLCDALGRIAAGPARVQTAAPRDDDGAYYFRLTTRPIDQVPFDAARTRIGEAVLRRQVLAGAYRLVDASALVRSGAPEVYLVGAGAVAVSDDGKPVVSSHLMRTALEYATTREQFDRPIAGFQLTQQKLADMSLELVKGFLLALHLGRLKDDGSLNPQQVSAGKLNNVREALAIARQARTILGASGITLEYPVLRHANNLESVLTYEGTSEIHTLALGHALTGISAYR
jgi:stage V sporulation protein SpoVS